MKEFVFFYNLASSLWVLVSNQILFIHTLLTIKGIVKTVIIRILTMFL